MRPIFVIATGQDDNLGDSLLRRGYLRALRSAGTLHIGLAGSSDDYIAGLGIEPTDVVHRTRRSWELGLLRAISTRAKPILALNAGEARVTAGHEYVGRRMWLLARAVSLGGGAVVQAGLGVREGAAARPSDRLRRFLAASDLVTWRDAESARAGGIGSVQPDWAFRLELGAPQAERDCVVVSMRGDRPLGSERWQSAVRRLADRHSLDVVVVSQVRRDEARARALVEAFGPRAELDLWDHGDHDERLSQLVERYASARIVVSDRLHALALGALCGAVPLGLATGTAEKLRRTLAPAGLARWTFDPEHIDELDVDLIPEANEIRQLVEAARAQTFEIERRMVELAARPWRRAR